MFANFTNSSHCPCTVRLPSATLEPSRKKYGKMKIPRRFVIHCSPPKYLMRFDLTQAAYRVFERASRIRLPNGLAAIDVAKLLMALSEEEETRAADWLTEAGLSLEAFRTAFGLGDMPMDTTPFSIGSLEQPIRDVEIRNVGSTTVYGDTNRGDSLHFFLDEQPVRIGRLSQELESTLWILLHRFGQSVSTGEMRTQPNLRFGLSNVPLATEHLLLAAALDEGTVGRWLHDNGLDPTTLFDKIEKLSTPNNPEPEVALPFAEPQPPNLEPRIHRLLDAVSNRASEALRVVEDYVRFVLDDRTLTSRLKEFRHELRRLLRPFSNTTQRDTEQDVGTELAGEGEYERREISDVLSANFGRLQESLRSLEEFSKLETPQVAQEFERLRYRSYTLHKEVLANCPPSPQERVRGNPRQTLPESVKLYALTDCGADETEFRGKIQSLIADGADVIQLRDKEADDRTLLERAKVLRELTQESERGVLFVVNDRPDLARLADADGVHVGQEELSVQDVRRIVGDEMLIGVSTHNIEQARTAVRDGANYLGAGPVFPSTTKEFETFPGLDFLREVAAEIRIPVFAIGGIDADNVSQVFETGIVRIAVSSAPLSSFSRYTGQ